MKYIILFFSFLGFSLPANAGMSWASQLAEVLVSVSSSLSLKLFLILQDALFPVLIVFSVVWMVFYVISLFLAETMKSGSEIAKELFKRMLTIGFVGIFFTVDPSFFFDLTIVPLINLALSYGSEILGATDPEFFKCVGAVSQNTTEGLFSHELQTRFICILDYLFKSLMFGVNMGIWLMVSAIASVKLLIFFPPLVALIYLKIIFAGVIISSFASLMIDLLWRFIDTLFYYIVGAVMIPFTFIGWAFKDEESKLLPYFSSWGGKAFEKFKQGTINLIFWCIAVAFLQYLISAALGEFSFTFGGEAITPDKIIDRDPEIFNEDGSIKTKFTSSMAFSFIPNLNGWLLLLGVAIFGKHLIKKIESMAKDFGGNSEGEIYGDLKKAGQGVEKWGKGKISDLKKSLLKWKKGS